MKKINANLIQFITSPSLLILLLFLLLQTFDESDANQAYNCSPSACGLIPNISFPFRLKDDPKHCGYPEYELACENNVTMIDLNSQKFHVKAINYDNRRIWLGHVSIKTNMTCSFPEYSVYAYNFSYLYPYGTGDYNYSSGKFLVAPLTTINFISCPYALNSFGTPVDSATENGSVIIAMVFTQPATATVSFLKCRTTSDIALDMIHLQRYSWLFCSS